MINPFFINWIFYQRYLHKWFSLFVVSNRYKYKYKYKLFMNAFILKGMKINEKDFFINDADQTASLSWLLWLLEIALQAGLHSCENNCTIKKYPELPSNSVGKISCSG